MEPGKFYHIYSHANGSENLFRSVENYRFFLKRYSHFTSSIADTYAYCLMPNHLHFLIRIKEEKDLEETFGKFETFQKLEWRISKQFSNLFSSYTQAYNKVFQRKGSLFIPNFKYKAVSSDAYLRTVLQYIHSNPVHHDFVNSIHDWPWSSYHTFLSQKPTSLKRNEVLDWFGGTKAYNVSHSQTSPIKIEMEF
ncbi:MAG TPA: transposase [Daejeonella sp.]|nr:transposase [Daejeonella sp.]